MITSSKQITCFGCGSTAVHAAGTQPDDDPPRAEERNDAVQAVVGPPVLLHQHDDSVSHGGVGQYTHTAALRGGADMRSKREMTIAKQPTFLGTGSGQVKSPSCSVSGDVT